MEGYRAVHNCRSDGCASLSVFVRKVVQCEITCNEKLDKNQLIMLNFRNYGFGMLAVYRDSAVRVPTQFLDHKDRLLNRIKAASLSAALTLIYMMKEESAGIILIS
jgi:hypothetical protein